MERNVRQMFADTDILHYVLVTVGIIIFTNNFTIMKNSYCNLSDSLFKWTLSLNGLYL